MEWGIRVGSASVASTIESHDPESFSERWFERAEQQLAVADATVEHKDRVTSPTRVREPCSVAADIGVSVYLSFGRARHIRTGGLYTRGYWRTTTSVNTP
jgi:hypothetical protein